MRSTDHAVVISECRHCKLRNRGGNADQRRQHHQQHIRQVSSSGVPDRFAFRSLLEAFGNEKLDKLQQALQQVNRHRRTILQWVPSHCGIQGNEVADKLAKQGASKKTTPFHFNEMKIDAHKGLHPNTEAER